jgi:hypothetical protein
MSTFTMVTLRDGSQVSEAILITTTMNIEAAAAAAAAEHCHVLSDLVEKCKDVGHRFVTDTSVDSKSILQQFNLINSNEQVDEDVRKIVLNLIEGSGLFLRLVNPIKKKVFPML